MPGSTSQLQERVAQEQAVVYTHPGREWLLLGPLDIR